MTTQSTTDPDLGGATGPLSRLALPVICLAQLMAALDVTIVNLSLPTVQGVLDLSNAGLAWVVDAYTLAYAGLLLVGGRAGDLIGHRRTLVLGIVLFTVASLVAGLAANPGTLLTARALQGAGAALATPTTLAMITTLFPVGPRRTAAMVGYGSMAGVGITLGLVLGGLLTEQASWRWVFWVNIPLGLLVLALAPRVLPETRGPRRRLDPAGGVIGTAALVLLVYGVIRAGTHHWGELRSTVTLIAGLVGLVVLALVERRIADPLLPLRLLQHRVRLGAYLVAGLLFASLYPTFFLLSRSLQDALELGPLAAGVRFLPVGVGVLAFAVLARRLTASLGPWPLVVAGTTATTLGTIGLIMMTPDSGYAWPLLPALVGLGAGVGTTFVATTALAMTDVDDADSGIGSGLLSTFQAVGGTLGVAVVATLSASRTRARLGDGPLSPTGLRDALWSGFERGFTASALLAGLAVAVAVVTGARRRRHVG